MQPNRTLPASTSREETFYYLDFYLKKLLPDQSRSKRLCELVREYQIRKTFQKQLEKMIGQHTAKRLWSKYFDDSYSRNLKFFMNSNFETNYFHIELLSF